MMKSPLKIIILVEEGVVENVYVPGEIDARYVVIDRDAELFDSRRRRNDPKIQSAGLCPREGLSALRRRPAGAERRRPNHPREGHHLYETPEDPPRERDPHGRQPGISSSEKGIS